MSSIFDLPTPLDTDNIGWFNIGEDQILVGRLNMNNPKHPALTLINDGRTRWSKSPEIPKHIFGHFTGGEIIHMSDDKKITLLTPKTSLAEQAITNLESKYNQQMTIYPEFMFVGDTHVNIQNGQISTVRFLINKSRFLRWGLQTDSHLSDTLHTEPIHRKRGQETFLFRADTSLGTISANNMQGQLDGQVVICLEFPKPASFDAIHTAVRKILLFLRFVSNYPVEIERLAISLHQDDDEDSSSSQELEVIPSPSLPTIHKNDEHDSFLAPIVADGNSMANLIANWTELGEKDQRWEARNRFDESCLRKGSVYDPDRLVAAANLFDLLPKSSSRASCQLSDESQKVIQSAKAVLKKLNSGSEGDKRVWQQVSDCLGRLKEPSLKDKVQVRAQKIIDDFSFDFSQLCKATDQAVNLRNRYVHGAVFKLGEPEDFVCFLTKTLEFVFVVSELIEAGWSTQYFSERERMFDHFISSYLHTYQWEIRSVINPSNQE